MAKQQAPTGRRATMVIAALVTLGAWAFVFLSLTEFPPTLNRKPHQALGAVLGGEAVKLLGPGGRLILISRDTTAFDNPALEAQLESFHAEVKKARISVSTTNLIKVDPLRLIAVPPGDFFEILRKTSENDVIVSFLGPPTLNDAQLGKLGGQRPKIVAVCSGAMPAQIDLRKVFDDKLLQIAIVSQRTVASASPGTDSLPGWFDHLYKIIRPENLSDLPVFGGARR